jgi:hypothetical protein
MHNKKINPTLLAALAMRVVLAFLATSSPGIAVLTASSPLSVAFLAPEQGTGPDTVTTTTNLRLFALPTARVSTAIRSLHYHEYINF